MTIGGRVVQVPGQLGPYRLVERLGHGGMCEVFRAETFGASGFAKTVALKVLLPKFRQEASYQRQFIREARIGAMLDHRNLVGIHDFGVADGLHYMRMELIDGADLASRVDGGVPVELAARIGAELALALDYLHRCSDERGRPLGLVHRDVSPSNVLVSRYGGVRLADFGILKATAYAEITRGNVRKGKLAYMSPEQLQGKALTPASDLFAWGILLAELVTGRHPFAGETELDTLDNLEQARSPDLEGAPEGLRELFARCLRADPAERFPSAGALYERISAHPLGSPLALGRWLDATLTS